MATFQLEQEEYEALISFAREGTKNDSGFIDQQKARNLDVFLKAIEKKNGFTRSAVWVQWQEMGQPLPPTAQFPSKWPPELRHYIEFVTRPVAKSDVEAVLRSKARSPVNVLVTRDPAGQLGWTELDKFFVR